MEISQAYNQGISSKKQAVKIPLCYRYFITDTAFFIPGYGCIYLKNKAVRTQKNAPHIGGASSGKGRKKAPPIGGA